MFLIQLPTISIDMESQEEVVKTARHLFFCLDNQLDIHDVSVTLLIY